MANPISVAFSAAESAATWRASASTEGNSSTISVTAAGSAVEDSRTWIHISSNPSGASGSEAGASASSSPSEPRRTRSTGFITHA